MSVNVPEMKFVKEEMEGSIFPYGFVQTSAELDDTVIKLQKVLDNLLSLAEIEKSCQLMADEIEKTRRRVNALEYSTIPNLEETVKDIRMKLDENERATITRLMKVKQMLEKNVQGEKVKIACYWVDFLTMKNQESAHKKLWLYNKWY